jgi:hypothetical protein
LHFSGTETNRTDTMTMDPKSVKMPNVIRSRVVVVGECQVGKTSLCRQVRSTRGRCYEHNFLRFLTIFCETIGVFLKNQCYDQYFSKFSFVLSQKRKYFRLFFLAKIFLNHKSLGPWSVRMIPDSW